MTISTQPALCELTDLEIDNVNGAALWLLVPVVCFVMGVAVGATVAAK